MCGSSGRRFWPSSPRQARNTPTDVLKKTLLELAIDADYVLDMHCDAEAVVHLYTLHPVVGRASLRSAALLGAHAVLVADDLGRRSLRRGVQPALARTAARLPGTSDPDGLPSPQRSNSAAKWMSADELAGPDAAAFVAFLTLRGGSPEGRPPLLRRCCGATPLAGSEPVAAPASGMVIFRRNVGDRVSNRRCGGRYRRSADRDSHAGAGRADGVHVRAHPAPLRHGRTTHRQGRGHDQHPDRKAPGRLSCKKKGRLEGGLSIVGSAVRWTALLCVTHGSRQRPGSRSRQPGTAGYDNETLDHLLFVVDGKAQYGLKPRIT